jgi:hypothetical protein
MNTIVGQLWRSGDTAPLIMPGSVPLHSDAVLTEITQYLEDAFKAVIDADVDGPGCTPAIVDQANPGRFGNRAVTQRLARTVFLGATPTLGTPNKGVERQRLFLGTALPGDVPGNYDSALNQLADNATYLYVSGPNFWFDTQANSTRTARDYANQLHVEDVYAEITRRLREHRRSSPDGFADVHVTDDSGDVPDRDEVRLVILHPRHAHDRKATDSAALAAARRIVEQRGTSHRVHRNTLVVLAADDTRMRELDAATRDYLAWDYVYDNATTALNLTPAQRKQAEQRRDKENETVRGRLLATYCWLLIPEQPNGDEPMCLRAVKAEGNGNTLADRAAAKLRAENDLVLQRAARLIRLDLDGRLRSVWREGHVDVGRLWTLYTTYPYLARMRNRDVLDAGVLSAMNDILDWAHYGFALADAFDPRTGTYSGLRIPGKDPAPARILDTTLLVRPDRVPEPVPSPPHPVPPPPHPVPVPPHHVPPTPPPTPIIVDVRRRFFGSRTLSPQRYGAEFATIDREILQHLASTPGVELEVRLEISATTPNGFPGDKIRIVEENATTLKFDQSGFEPR